MEESDVERFVLCVQNREILWNLCHPQYKNVKKKAQEWQNIAYEFCLPIDVVKKKWKGLRDSYSRSISRKKSSGQAAEEPEYESKYGGILEFLKEHLKPRMTTSNYSSMSLDDTATPSSPVTPWDETDDEQGCSGFSKTPDTPILAISPIRQLSEGSSSSRARKKREASLVEETFVDTMHTVQEFLRKPRATAFPSSSTNLEDELFCRSLLEKLRTFTLQQRNEAKLGMLKYLNDFQMEHVAKSGQ